MIFKRVRMKILTSANSFCIERKLKGFLKRKKKKITTTNILIDEESPPKQRSTCPAVPCNP